MNVYDEAPWEPAYPKILMTDHNCNLPANVYPVYSQQPTVFGRALLLQIKHTHTHTFPYLRMHTKKTLHICTLSHHRLFQNQEHLIHNLRPYL